MIYADENFGGAQYLNFRLLGVGALALGLNHIKTFWISSMMDIHNMMGKHPQPKKGFVLPYHISTGTYNLLHKQLDEYDQLLAGQEPYNAVDAISMQHDICYRDNETKEGKHVCDDKMLKELLVVLEPKGIKEKIDRKFIRTIIGTKRNLGWWIDWSNELADELHKPIQMKFKKRTVFASGADAIWTADLVDMQSFLKSNKDFKYILMIIDVFSKYGW